MNSPIIQWRRGGDSNSRGGLLPPNDLANRPLQPLGYLSSLNILLQRQQSGLAHL
jgi:hypothetical protein